jgi:hypothetical protein
MNFLAVLLAHRRTGCAGFAAKLSGTCRGSGAIFLYVSDVVLVIASFFQVNHHWVQVVPLKFLVLSLVGRVGSNKLNFETREGGGIVSPLKGSTLFHVDHKVSIIRIRDCNNRADRFMVLRFSFHFNSRDL